MKPVVAGHLMQHITWRWFKLGLLALGVLSDALAPRIPGSRLPTHQAIAAAVPRASTRRRLGQVRAPPAEDY